MRHPQPRIPPQWYGLLLAVAVCGVCRAVEAWRRWRA